MKDSGTSQRFAVPWQAEEAQLSVVASGLRRTVHAGTVAIEALMEMGVLRQ